MKRIRRVRLIAVAAVVALIGITNTAMSGSPTADGLVTVLSPDGQIRAEVFLQGGGNGVPQTPAYRVFLHDRPMLMASPLGIDLADGSSLGADSQAESAQVRPIRESYIQHPGKRREVVVDAREAEVIFKEKAGPQRRWSLLVRVFNDGVALRYAIPAQEPAERIWIAGERTGFALPGRALAHALPLASFTTSHEARYLHEPVATLPKNQLFGLPLLTEIPETGFVAMAEANLSDHAGLYLERTGDTAFRARLSPLPDDPKVAVRADLPHSSPWRVLMIADTLPKLVESDLILNLNEPNAIGDTSWIRPGKTTFPWWNGFYEKDVPFKMGLNTETAKYYIDFCAESGIPYHSLDGLDNIAWYGGTIVPYEGAGITQGIEGLDLQEVIRYATSRNVKLRLWMHWEAARKHMETAFPLYRKWGIEGVMLDFVDRDDQEAVNFLRKAVKLAAENHLTVTLHGVSAPTGLERTFPNLLNHEAVMNLEYDKWDPQGIRPDHEATIPFTRMLAGPLDFHQGSFRGVRPEEFHPQNAAPLIIGTPCRTLASYVALQNHLPMAADYPSSYRGHPATPILAQIPCTWDDTRCLAAEVGKQVIIARRSGDEWWVGAMNDSQAREVKIPLSFLADGTYRAEIHQDALTEEHRMKTRTATVTGQDAIEATLEPAGGVLIHLVPVGTPPG